MVYFYLENLMNQNETPDEHKQYIGVLRDFVKIRLPRVSVAHLIVGRTQHRIIYRQSELITYIGDDDEMISHVVNLVPTTLYIYGRINDPLAVNVREIFGKHANDVKEDEYMFRREEEPARHAVWTWLNYDKYTEEGRKEMEEHFDQLKSIMTKLTRKERRFLYDIANEHGMEMFILVERFAKGYC
jgi:hypothetical protein